jgi:hypothetical protein
VVTGNRAKKCLYFEFATEPFVSRLDVQEECFEQAHCPCPSFSRELSQHSQMLVLSSWREAVIYGTVLSMSTPSDPYRGFRYPAEIINQAVWLYHCFSLSLRDVELILAARGIVVSYETIRAWSLRFGRTYARTLKRRRPQPGDK